MTTQLVDIQTSRVYNCVLFIMYTAGDKIEKNEMGWACGSYGGGEGGV